TAATETARPNRWLTVGAWRELFRDRPLLPLSVLLLLLVGLVQVLQPGTVNSNWVAVIVRQSVPLAILAGCQTLAMLTGGIDLSVGAVASMAAFVMATLVNGQGPVVAVLAGLGVALAAGVGTGVGIGVFKVHPLIMTLGMSL